MKLKELKQLGQKISILYVEDDEEIGIRVYKYLTNIFDDVDYLPNGQEALLQYSKKQYDLVITDILMPKLNGLEMLKEILKIDPTQTSLVTSAYSDPDLFVESIKLGVNGYILKPIDFNQMNLCIGRSVEKIVNEKQIKAYQENLEKLVEEKTESLRIFEQAIESSTNGVLITTEEKDTPIVYANQAFEDMTGYGKG